MNFSTLDLKTTLRDDFSSESCAVSRDIIWNDGNKTTEGNSQPGTIRRLGKTLFHN